MDPIIIEFRQSASGQIGMITAAVISVASVLVGVISTHHFNGKRQRRRDRIRATEFALNPLRNAVANLIATWRDAASSMLNNWNLEYYQFSLAAARTEFVRVHHQQTDAELKTSSKTLSDIFEEILRSIPRGTPIEQFGLQMGTGYEKNRDRIEPVVDSLMRRIEHLLADE